MTLAYSRVFNAISFFDSYIKIFLKAQMGKNYSPPAGAGQKLTFKQFTSLTNGVRLVVTGTNLSQKRSFFFSDIHTPDFPVAAACFISMCIPPFKPVWVESEVDKKDTVKSALYKGLWVDGGVLNNFPIHAFDDTKSKDSDFLLFNRQILGFRLVDGFQPGSGDGVVAPKKPGDLEFGGYLSLMLGTALYPGSEGQLRSAREEEQTVKLYAGKLSTYNFTAKENDFKAPLQAAYDSVMSHYPQAS